jgi:hypothetical protein
MNEDRNKKREYVEDKINELESNSKNKNTRDLYKGITEFKQGYQSRTNLVKNERGDLLVDPHTVVKRWNNYFCQLLYRGWVMAGRLTFTQQSHLCQSLVMLRLKLLLES